MSATSSPLSSAPSSLSSPSSPLSILARSPTPPADYPSPPSSNVSDVGTNQSRDATVFDRDATISEDRDTDGPPPAKRQRIMKPRELKTEYLNLTQLNESNNDEDHKIQDPKVQKLMDVLRTKKKIVVIAGAGISVSAGVPDFRSSKGLFTSLRDTHKVSSGKQLFEASVYRNDSSTGKFHDMVRTLSQITRNAQPTAFHHMLARLAKEGRLLRLYSQNVDGIDTSLEPLTTKVPLNMKAPWPKTIQLHGGLDKMVCQKCGHLADFDASLFEGSEPPGCPECITNDAVRFTAGLRSHGIGRLRPRMVLYDEHPFDADAIGAVSEADLKARPDAVIVVGTSLKIRGIRRLAKEMCSITRSKRGGFTAWVNYDPEPTDIYFKDCWDMVIKGECDEVARLIDLPKWDDNDVGEWKRMEGNTAEKKNSKPEVLVESKPALVNLQGLHTPADSPRPQRQSPEPSKSKLMQPPLLFGNPVVSDGKVKKKRAPNRPKKDPKGKATNKITNAFSSTKVSKSTAEKPKSLENISTSHSIKEKDEPQTPKRLIIEIPLFDRDVTVSPPSKPSGMGNLID